VPYQAGPHPDTVRNISNLRQIVHYFFEGQKIGEGIIFTKPSKITMPTIEYHEGEVKG
jgi:hypothetical protein